MSQVNTFVDVQPEPKYKLVPPDGGWGYFVVVAFIFFTVITSIPNNAFGLLYGDFLESIGNETTGTALSSGLFFTFQSFSGFITDYLLKKYSFRKVALLGATLYFSGAFGISFVHTLPHMIICFSVMQGLACGLLMAAMISSFNSYFTEKINLMMGVAQSILVLCVMLIPYVVEVMVRSLGFRYSLYVLCGLALLNFLAAIILEPVEKHMKKVYIENEDDVADMNENTNKGKEEEEVPIVSTIPVIQDNIKYMGVIEAKMRASLSNLGERSNSCMTLNQKQKRRSGLEHFKLFTDWKFLAVNVGLSTSFWSEVSFIALIPVLLGEIHFSSRDIAFMMTVFFACDLGARILYSIVSAFYRVRSRYVYLAGTVLSVIFRIIFNAHNSFAWRLSSLAILGFLRCFLQTTLMLVLTEEYKTNFPSAFSASMILSGLVNLTFGLLASLLNHSFGKSMFVFHLLTLGFVICIVLWTIELIYTKYKTK